MAGPPYIRDYLRYASSSRRNAISLPQQDRGSQSAAEESMLAAAEELHEEADHRPSAVAGCTDIPVSFDSSWKTRGFYSNLGFGSAISALTKKVLDYELLKFLIYTSKVIHSVKPTKAFILKLLTIYS